MNKAVIAACMGLLVVAGCSKDKKPVSSEAGMTPPPPPTVLSPAPEPMVTPIPMSPVPAPEPAPAAPARTSKVTPKTTHATPAAKTQSSTASKKFYVVKKGDSLSKIAVRYKTTVAKLMKANPKIKAEDKILIGQKLNIP